MLGKIFNTRRNLAALACGMLAALVLSACGGGSSPASLPGTAGTPAPPPSVQGDDWITMGHDFSRSGYQMQSTGITAANVGKLTLSWKVTLPAAQGGIIASPLVFGGVVVVVSRGVPGSASQPAVVYALNATNGRTLWTRRLAGEVRGTPTIADGHLFVGDRAFTSNLQDILPSHIYSLDMLTGNIAWQTQIVGASRSSPLVVGGVVYAGVSGGDPPQCIQGGLVALNESTGATMWKYNIESKPGMGGSVWSPITYENGLIVFGTGNTCSQASPIGNAVVALDTSGATKMTFQPRLPGDNSLNTDDDQGGGILATGGNLFFINKNGSYYGLTTAGSETFAHPLGASEGNGDLSTPSSDGTTVVVGAGTLNVAAPSYRLRGYAVPFPGVTDASGRILATGATQGKIVAFDMMGNQRWSSTMTYGLYGQVAINGGIVYAGVDNNLEGLDLNTGKVLWKFVGPAYFAPSPAVVPSGVYAADAGGNVYRFQHP